MRRPPRNRRLLVLLAAVLIAGVLVAPIVLRGHRVASSGCNQTLRYAGRVYEQRSTAGTPATQSVALGVGVLSGCGGTPTNVNVRSLIGIAPARAIGIDESSDLYVRAGVCVVRTGAQLARCLAASGS